jgi:uncharacterized protein (TIGR00106 family)
LVTRGEDSLQKDGPDPKRKKVIVAEISIYPVGEGTSLSKYVKKAIEAINGVRGLRTQVTPMGTILESEDLEQILEALRVAHQAILEMGARRIVATLKVDDRRDKARRMEDKVLSVQS